MAELVGRRAERAAVEQLLAEARSGRSGVLVVRGEAGIGKSALLQHARTVAASSGFRVEGSVGTEAETQFAFAGVHQLCATVLDRAAALPAPQQDALGVAFGSRSGAVPERFLVGLAVLNLLAEVAEDRPLLCLFDDAQWLDRASAEILSFVARRVAGERVVLLFALRDLDEGGTHPVDGLPELQLAGLGDVEARAVMAAALRTPLDDGVRDRIVAEARGNPLALLELPRVAEPARLAGGFAGPDLLGVPRRVEEEFSRRSGSLPAGTQTLLMIAAAEPTGEAALLWRAAGMLGIDDDAAAPAEAARLVEIGSRVRFRHPLVRSAVYRAAGPADRRRVHAALAEATDPRSDPDRRAWHRAKAAQGSDEEVAAELERSADRARARGGLAAAAWFLERATELTPEPARRTERALEAAHVMHESGASEVALALLAVAADGPSDARQRARLDLLHARIAFHRARGSDVPAMLLRAAGTLAPLDPALARETYLHALDAAIIIGPAGDGPGVLRIAEAAAAAPAPPGPPEAVDLLLDALVTAYTRGYEAAVPGLRRAVLGFRERNLAVEVPCDHANHRFLWMGCRAAVALFDDELVHELATRNLRLLREIGALAALPAALLFRSMELVLTGDLAEAAELADEQTVIARAIGFVPLRHDRLFLAAWRGDRSETVRLYEATVETAHGREAGTEVALASYTLAVLENGLGNYAAAVDAAERACGSEDLAHSSLALPELVEAAVRAGRAERAAEAVERLGARADASGTSWALGLEARSRALTTPGPEAEKYYRGAIELLGGCRMATHLARTHLVYGEWLRRNGRRQDAREQLQHAHEQLAAMGAEAFAARAARELRATGEHPRRRTARPTDTLTAQELHIARLVSTGATTPEIASQLFLSPRTIETHLRNIFRKLGITSRRQLRELYAG
ncbi:AAA family ATPase [Pseudonocardia nematodicida]|uniref:AAA family ATPase n=1 Tax=Pseudonocardia nematodicida TaxID=1206997 RepID=A0ABV1KK02_9PSEU